MSKPEPSCLILFPTNAKTISVPASLNNPFEGIPTEIAEHAADKVKAYLQTTKDFEHNFGLGLENPLKPHGKMFGVLVVENQQAELGYLMAFSGKLLGENNLEMFVPPVGQADRDEVFVNEGMTALTAIGGEISRLQESISKENQKETFAQVEKLREKRKAHSQKLQQQIFEAYYFSNALGDQKTLLDIFANSKAIRPPSGAGECAAPKLFQYAFEHQLRPISIAEFWWGKSRKSLDKQHGCFYPACQDKCKPILEFMLQGL